MLSVLDRMRSMLYSGKFNALEVGQTNLMIWMAGLWESYLYFTHSHTRTYSRLTHVRRIENNIRCVYSPGIVYEYNCYLVGIYFDGRVYNMNLWLFMRPIINTALVEAADDEDKMTLKSWPTIWIWMLCVWVGVWSGCVEVREQTKSVRASKSSEKLPSTWSLTSGPNMSQASPSPLF